MKKDDLQDDAIKLARQPPVIYDKSAVAPHGTAQYVDKSKVTNNHFYPSSFNSQDNYRSPIVQNAMRQGRYQGRYDEQSNIQPLTCNFFQQRENYPSVKCDQRIESNDVKDGIIPEFSFNRKIEELILEYALHNRKLGKPQPFYSWLQKENHLSYLSNGRVNANEANFSKKSRGSVSNLSKGILSNVDFKRAEFSYADLTDTDFTASNLEDADLSFVEGLCVEQLCKVQSDINFILIDPGDHKNTNIRKCANYIFQCQVEMKSLRMRIKELEKENEEFKKSLISSSLPNLKGRST